MINAPIVEYTLRMPDLNIGRDSKVEGADCLIVEWGDDEGLVRIHLNGTADESRGSAAWESDVVLDVQQVKILLDALNRAVKDNQRFAAGGVA